MIEVMMVVAYHNSDSDDDDDAPKKFPIMIILPRTFIFRLSGLVKCPCH